MRAALVPMARPRARWWACSTRSGGRGFHFGRPPALHRPGAVHACRGRTWNERVSPRLLCSWEHFACPHFFDRQVAEIAAAMKNFVQAWLLPRVYVTHGRKRGHGVGRAGRRDERRHGARCGIPEENHHRLANTDVASAIGAPTMRLLRPMHIPARSLATRPARPSNPPTRTGWMPTAKIPRLEEGRPQIGLLIAIERIAYDEVRSCPIGRFGPWNQRSTHSTSSPTSAAPQTPY